MRIAFAGTPEFAKIQLEALLNTSHEVVVVYTQPDRPVGRGQHVQPSPVKTVALAHDIPIEQPEHLKDISALAQLEKYHVDVMIVAAYGLLLPSSFLQIPKFGCINVHASLLPRWRGASPIQQAILHGDKETGITLMKMDVGLDTGNILAQAPIDISNNETSTSLHDKLAQTGAHLLQTKLESIVGKVGQPQDPQFATLAPKITKQQAKVDWNESAVDIARKIRAFNPWPIAFSELDGTIVRLWEAQAINQSLTGAPGTILDHTELGIIVATSDGGLLITAAQLPGKKHLPVPEILKSQHELFAKGQQFK